LFAQLYGTSVLGLRYFNVYGPRQDPASPYAGVISRFASQLAQNAPLTIFGDGLQTRDFVFVGDVARANVAALRSDAVGIVNIGTGASVSLLHLVDTLAACVGRSPETSFGPAVVGDIRHSSMEPKRMREVLGFAPATALAEGLNALIAR
jgi:UDP-glucose 4-epimerase